MKHKTLVTATVGEVLLLVVILAGYLIVIANGLRRVSRTLAKVSFGVRAIEKQTETIGPALHDTNASLEQVAMTLQRES